MKKFALFVSLMFTFPLLAAQESRIVAVINKDVITQRDLDNRLKLAFLSSGLPDTAANRKELGEQILHSMIDETLQIQAIDDANIEISQADIDAAITHMEEASGSPKGSIRQLLKVNHIPDSTLTKQAKAQLGWVDKLHGNYMPLMQVADSEVDRELKKLQGEQQLTQYHLAEIVLPVDDQISDAKARQDILKLRADIQRGAHFSAVAQQFSHAATAALGGDLGWQIDDQLAPEVKTAIDSLRPGEMSPPIRTAGGYTLLLYIARQRPGEVIDTLVSLVQAQIPYPFLPTDYEVEETTQKLAQLGHKAKSCSAFKNVLKPIEGSSAQESGKIPLDQLNPEVLSLIKGLKPGEISEPIPTKEGPITIMLCSREDIKPEEWTKDSVMNMLIQRKMKLFSRRDLRDLKRNAFIQIRQ